MFIIRSIISIQLKKTEYLNICHLNYALIKRENIIFPLNGPDGLISNYFHHTQQSVSLLPNGICQYNEKCSLIYKTKRSPVGPQIREIRGTKTVAWAYRY